MTRAERKAIEKARMAIVAVRVFAKQRALRQVKNEAKARGERISDYSHKQWTLMAEARMGDPEIVAEARAMAMACGYIAA